MYCIVYHCKGLLYNATLVVTIASCGAKILPFMTWWDREGNVPNLGSTEKSTVVLIEIII